MDNKEIKLFCLLLALILLPFVTTLLLDWPWVQAQTIRQILVYGIIALQLFVLGREIYNTARVN